MSLCMVTVVFLTIVLPVLSITEVITYSSTRKSTVGECITLTATSNFAYTTTVVWKKGHHLVQDTSRVTVDGYSLSIKSLDKSDHGFYSVELHRDDVIEITDIWLNVQGCKEHQAVEITTECQSLCVDKCNEGWIFIAGIASSKPIKCAKYYAVAQTWSHSRDVCKQDGSRLLNVESEIENDFLVDRLSKHGVWLDLSDVITEGVFLWSDNTRPVFTAWSHDEPNNYNLGCNLENCVCVNKEGMWRDSICEEAHHVLCQVQRNNQTNNETEGVCTDSKCFHLIPSFDIWSTNLCETVGGSLASINSQLEVELAKELVTRDTWIGLNDIKEAGVYSWKNGDEVTFTNWARGEPNDMFYSTASCTGEDCVQARYEHVGNVTYVRWHDLPCHTLLPYFCEQYKVEDTVFWVGVGVGACMGVCFLLFTVYTLLRKHRLTTNIRSTVKCATQVASRVQFAREIQLDQLRMRCRRQQQQQ